MHIYLKIVVKREVFYTPNNKKLDSTDLFNIRSVLKRLANNRLKPIDVQKNA